MSHLEHEEEVASYSKVVHSEDHFSEEGLFRSRFSKSSFTFKRKWKVRVPSHASVSKYYEDKTYANLWFIFLQVTKGFRFQKNKNVRFISGNQFSYRFTAFLNQRFAPRSCCLQYLLIVKKGTMSHLEHEEEEIPLRDNVGLRYERFSSAMSRFFVALKWICAVLVLAFRLVGISMFIVWASDCFIREFHTTTLCVSFFLFPSPKIFEIVWLSLCVITSSFLIFYVCNLNHFHGFLPDLQHLIKKKYFWKLVVTLILACIYDLLTMLNKPETLKTLSYVLFMCEKSSAVVAALFLNFLPGGLFQNNSAMKLRLYRAVLFVYALEGYTMAMLGSTIAVYKVLTVPSTPVSNDAPDTEAVVSLMLLIINNGLRYYLAEFFFSKFFDQDEDFLGGGTSLRSILNILAQPATEDEDQEGTGASSQMQPLSQCRDRLQEQ